MQTADLVVRNLIFSLKFSIPNWIWAPYLTNSNHIGLFPSTSLILQPINAKREVATFQWIFMKQFEFIFTKFHENSHTEVWFYGTVGSDMHAILANLRSIDGSGIKMAGSVWNRVVFFADSSKSTWSFAAKKKGMRQNHGDNLNSSLKRN